MDNKKIVTFKVNGIHCMGCVSKIEKNLNTLNADHIVDINIETGKVKISFDAKKATLADIKSKISESGYQVESVELE